MTHNEFRVLFKEHTAHVCEFVYSQVNGLEPQFEREHAAVKTRLCTNWQAGVTDAAEDALLEGYYRPPGQSLDDYVSGYLAAQNAFETNQQLIDNYYEQARYEIDAEADATLSVKALSLINTTLPAMATAVSVADNATEISDFVTEAQAFISEQVALIGV